MSKLVLLVKSHIAAFTRKDGTYVAAHEDSRHAGHSIVEGKDAGGGRTWEIHKDGKKVAEYGAHIAKKKVLDHHFSTVDAEAAKKAKRSASAKDGATNRAKSKETKAALDAAMKEHGDLISRVHHNRELQFKALPIDAFDSKDSVIIHQSSGYGKNKGSSYRLVMVGGKPAYARASDHWGEFHTNERTFDDNSVKEGDTVSEDSTGKMLSKRHKWDLEGHEPKGWGGERKAGYILLEDLERMNGGKVMAKAMLILPKRIAA